MVEGQEKKNALGSAGILLFFVAFFWFGVKPIVVKVANSFSEPPTSYCNNLRGFDMQSGVLYADDSFKPGGICYHVK